MIIDCHGHFTTAPAQLARFRDRQLARLIDPSMKVLPATLAYRTMNCAPAWSRTNWRSRRSAAPT